MIRLPVKTVNSCCGWEHDGRSCEELKDVANLFGCVLSVTPSRRNPQPLQLARTTEDTNAPAPVPLP